MPDTPLTADEYETRMWRLKENAESARVALNNARAYYDGLCDEMRNLRITYREQQAATGQGGDQ